LAVTSCTFTISVCPAGTLNEKVPVGLGLEPMSPAQLVQMLLGSKLPTYPATKMKLVPVHEVLTSTVTHMVLEEVLV
jgi:hypothetical protein